MEHLVGIAAEQLAEALGQAVTPTYATSTPRTGERASSETFVAPSLLAPGLFHRTLRVLPVRGVADPLGAHPAVLDLVVRRYRAARSATLAA